MKALLFDEPTQRISFEPIQFAKTATRLANERNIALQREIFIMRLVIIVLLAVIASLI